MRRARAAAVSFLLGSVALLAIAGCSEPAPSFDRVGLFTQDGPPGGSACPDTAIEGVLAWSDEWMIGVAAVPGGDFRAVVWPPGYGAARTASGLVLLDEQSRIVARVRDRVKVGGWDMTEGHWFACRPVVLPSTSPG